MPIKIDGTNNKVIFYAGTGNATTLTSASTATPWTATLPTTAGAAGQALITDGSGNLSWGSSGTSVTVTDDNTTNSALYPLFTATNSGALSAASVSSTKFQYNPSTGVLSAQQMASNQGMHLNSQTITASYTLPAGYNALSAGPITQGAGVVVTVPAGQAWVVV